MKRTMIVLTMLLALCFAQVPQVQALGSWGDWKKAKNNSWPGVVNEQTYWYKLDDRVLWLSSDGKQWDRDTDGMWTDKEGSFFKIDGDKPVWSPDAGNTWSDVKDWKWQAVDGKWYKLDKDWTVWVSK